MASTVDSDFLSTLGTSELEITDALQQSNDLRSTTNNTLTAELPLLAGYEQLNWKRLPAGFAVPISKKKLCRMSGVLA